MEQLEMDLGLDPLTEMMIDVEQLKQKQEAIRRSFFARMAAMEKMVEEQNVQIEFLKREIEAMKICY